VSTQTDSWPAALWLVRHGESAGNVARNSAEREGKHEIAISGRDIDVPLSELGVRQARAFGEWVGATEQPPTVVLSSPFVRARQTADLIIEASGLGRRHVRLVLDERLREKEFGSLNRFTKLGIAVKFPHEAARYAEVGKFYYRPPGGESWCDVILRLRSVLHHVQLQYAGERVLIVGHQVIVLCFRYLLEELSEEEILAIDREQDVANCSLTSFELGVDRDGRNKLRLKAYNFVTPIAAAGAEVTTRPDGGVG
jgi:probable phosphoglycerate mutase